MVNVVAQPAISRTKTETARIVVLCPPPERKHLKNNVKNVIPTWNILMMEGIANYCYVLIISLNAKQNEITVIIMFADPVMIRLGMNQQVHIARLVVIYEKWKVISAS